MDCVAKVRLLSEVELPAKSGGFNRSMQHWLGVYSQEFQSPRCFAGVYLAQRYFVDIGLRIADMLVFLGRYCRSIPFVFLLVPRCQGLCKHDAANERVVSWLDRDPSIECNPVTLLLKSPVECRVVNVMRPYRESLV